MKFQVKVVDERLKNYNFLSRGSVGSAGVDLHAMIEDESMGIDPGETILIPTGLHIWICNPNFAGLIMARSSTSIKRGLAPANKVGLIDSDYQGPLMVGLHNHSSEFQMIDFGERIAQLVIVPVVNAQFEIVDKFYNETIRGEGGFGSTGT